MEKEIGLWLSWKVCIMPSLLPVNCQGALIIPYQPSIYQNRDSMKHFTGSSPRRWSNLWGKWKEDRFCVDAHNLKLGIPVGAFFSDVQYAYSFKKVQLTRPVFWHPCSGERIIHPTYNVEVAIAFLLAVRPVDGWNGWVKEQRLISVFPLSTTSKMIKEHVERFELATFFRRSHYLLWRYIMTHLRSYQLFINSDHFDLVLNPFFFRGSFLPSLWELVPASWFTFAAILSYWRGQLPTRNNSLCNIRHCAKDPPIEGMYWSQWFPSQKTSSIHPNESREWLNLMLIAGKHKGITHPKYIIPCLIIANKQETADESIPFLCRLWTHQNQDGSGTPCSDG